MKKRFIIGLFGILLISSLSVIINVEFSTDYNNKVDIHLISLKKALADGSEICSVNKCYKYRCGSWGPIGCATTGELEECYAILPCN